MIIKIIPTTLPFECKKFLHECKSFSIDESYAETWEKAQEFYRNGVEDREICYGGQKRTYPTNPDCDRQPMMRIVLDGDTSDFKAIRIIGLCEIFVMNDSGKTVDRFSN
ncbi:MAG: hypothetical protein PHF86_13045 [Candidatus Nanoarchaeia archaeon]|nr:hypothetical protein [Candidatus Nanoarchaeia archaeon]